MRTSPDSDQYIGFHLALRTRHSNIGPKVIAIIALISMGLVLGCESTPPLPPSQEIVAIDTSYVPIAPAFSGFTVEVVGSDTLGPEDILIGNDQLLYVADTRGNRVVMMNRAGQVLSANTMLHPRSLAQNSRLDLYVGGEMVAPSGDTVGALFKIRLYSANSDSAHRLDLAPIDTIWKELARPARRFPAITVLGDNQFLAVRTGPDNSSFIDPDARVLLFDDEDVFITPVPSLTTRVGSGITDINKPTGIALFPGTRDFVLSQSSEGVSYGAVWMRYERTVDFDGWLPRFDPARAEDRNIDFIRPNRYGRPEAVAIDRSRRDIFIADAQLDSVFKFNSRGRFRGESFGLHRTQGAMMRPTGLAFFERILYVLDGRTGEVLRFRLSTDVPR